MRVEADVGNEEKRKIGDEEGAVEANEIEGEEVAEAGAGEKVAEDPIQVGSNEEFAGSMWAVTVESEGGGIFSEEVEREESGDGKDVEGRKDVSCQADDHQSCRGFLHLAA